MLPTLLILTPIIKKLHNWLIVNHNLELCCKYNEKAKYYLLETLRMFRLKEQKMSTVSPMEEDNMENVNKRFHHLEWSQSFYIYIILFDYYFSPWNIYYTLLLLAHVRWSIYKEKSIEYDGSIYISGLIDNYSGSTNGIKYFYSDFQLPFSFWNIFQNVLHVSL